LFRSNSKDWRKGVFSSSQVTFFLPSSTKWLLTLIYLRNWLNSLNVITFAGVGFHMNNSVHFLLT
jgi:hypothetical protein